MNVTHQMTNKTGSATEQSSTLHVDIDEEVFVPPPPPLKRQHGYCTPSSSPVTVNAQQQAIDARSVDVGCSKGCPII